MPEERWIEARFLSSGQDRGYVYCRDGVRCAIVGFFIGDHDGRRVADKTVVCFDEKTLTLEQVIEKTATIPGFPATVHTGLVRLLPKLIRLAETPVGERRILVYGYCRIPEERTMFEQTVSSTFLLALTISFAVNPPPPLGDPKSN